RGVEWEVGGGRLSGEVGGEWRGRGWELRNGDTSLARRRGHGVTYGTAKFWESSSGFDMKTRSKIWLGVGAFVVVGTGATSAMGLFAAEAASGLSARPGLPTDAAILSAGGTVLAQHAAQGRDAGEGGETKDFTGLPPELAFAARIALLRGHLLVGDELVKQQQWNAALPHFLHPTEEIYGDIKGELAEYKVSPFDAALKALSDVVKAKKGGNDYAKALKSVNDALAAVDAGMKAKQADWPGFVVEAAVEALKAAT